MVSTCVLHSAACLMAMTSARLPAERCGFHGDGRKSTGFGHSTWGAFIDLPMRMDLDRDAFCEHEFGPLDHVVEGRVGLDGVQAAHAGPLKAFRRPLMEEDESAQSMFSLAVSEPSFLHPVPSQWMLAKPNVVAASLTLSVPDAMGLARDAGIFDALREAMAAHVPGIEVSTIEIDVITVKKCRHSGQVDYRLFVDCHVDVSADACQCVPSWNVFAEPVQDAIAVELVDRMANLHQAQP